jgi:hypothetical protein
MNTRLHHAQHWVQELLSEPAIDAVVADGWPRPMAHAGFELHKKTWDVLAMASVVAQELQDVSRIPNSVAHLWPALPGAGVSPLLYSYLVGVPNNYFKPSRRGSNFGMFAGKNAPQGVEIGEWNCADVVVVSGSNETVDAVQKRAKGRVVAYGHRVSYAVVDDQMAEPDIQALARDTVMWHQQGCFSLRGVVFVGPFDRASAFCAALADAIAEQELLWQATLSEARLAERAQALGLAEFEGSVFRARAGFVVLKDAPLLCHWRSPHAVEVVQVDSIDEVSTVVKVPLSQVQGIAATKNEYANVAQTLGATRVCRPGELQAPEADWPHDGQPNVGVLLL